MFSYVKNKFIEQNRAKISINERGFKYADGFFDTILINNFQPYLWNYHLELIINNLKILDINFDIQIIESISKQLIQKNNFENGLLRIYISRGIGSIGYLPNDNIEPSLIIETIPSNSNLDKNSKLWLSQYKKIPDICFPSGMKSAYSLQSVLARIEAKKNNCAEALLLTINDIISDCSSSNIFWIKNKIIYTPDKSTNCYLGTIRHGLLELLNGKIVFSESKIEDILDADEVFVTNVSWRIKQIDEILNYQNYNKYNYIPKIAKILDEDIKEKTRLKAW